MNVRSDPAGALHEMLGIPRIAPLQNDFNPTEHLPGAPGVNDFSSGHLDFDSQVALDAGYRINYNSFSHIIFLPVELKGVRLVGNALG
jgi:hypothetical protein